MTLHEAPRSNLLPSWTEERVAALKRHAAAGLSASQIAAELGNVTRNAVIGKLIRIGAKLTGTRAQKAYARPREPTRAKTHQPARLKIRPGFNSNRASEIQRIEATEILDLPPDQSDFACTIVELEEGMCRYPIGEANDLATFRYCGAACVGSWCARHRAIVFTRAERA